jgi:phosphatidylserine decarboxylase
MKKYIIYNRATQDEESEASGNITGLSFLYRSLAGKVVKPILTRQFVSRNYGRYVKSRRSVSMIKSFIRQYNIDVSELRRPLDSFTSLNDFFIRELKPEARPVDAHPAHLISPADARLFIFDLDKQDSLPVKGYWYSLKKFTSGSNLTQAYSNGWCFVYRLAPCDYHRFCYIDKGHQEIVRRIKGKLNSVNPIAMTRTKSLLAKNYRELTILHTENFGTALHFEVGALMVGKVILHHREEYAFSKGEEKGWFEFGGSTIVQLFKKDSVKPDSDILGYSENGIETLVKMGEKVGAADFQ